MYGKMSKSDKTIPQIRFEGQWLQALGFCVGDKIKLDCKENRIITHTSHTKNRHIIGSYATLGI